VPTPPGALVPRGARARAADLPKGPWIVKPVASDASEGIDAQSVVPRFGSRLHAAVRRVHERLGQDAVVERLFGTREFNIGMFEHRGEVRMLPVAEIDFSRFEPGRPRIVDYAAKWLPNTFEFQNTPRVAGVRLPPRVARALTAACHAAWHALGCRDYARVDVRAEADGRLAIIEVNPNPDITPIAGFSCGLRDAGIAYEQFVLALVENATARLPSAARRARPARPVRGEPLPIRATRRGDREEILSFLRATRFFRPHELEIADEVLSDAILKGDASHYDSHCVEAEGRPAGWICFGPTPCTQGTYDIYWIAVAPEAQRLGLGRRLLEYAERRIAEKGGRMVTIETSGRPVYEPTRHFYRKLGYRESACLRDFYGPGDDKVVFLKPLYQPHPAS
jgi:ribosomal protein S18 acetylase RimI-like enzyme